MSLLDRGRETVFIYMEEVVEDRDGNKRSRPSKTPIRVDNVSLQPVGQSGTSARRAEQDNEGYESEQVFRMRLPRSCKLVPQAQSEVIWKGQRFAVFGDAKPYNGSDRTRHNDYSLRRS
ncbi:head-to-tail stopper [Rhodococcus phage WC1]|uniref:Head-to-tail stopper n=2 Tax=Rerduovirus RER2 TaxID=1982376 RepID=G9FHX4_9CAUD|nr:head closure Hc1 [Rhodococcus phage RER2]YP_009189668.1 head closure Hc1 [Rhodococcus phage CosmicSans]ALA46218.1 head-to-tail stopper [Rhodococcus phage Rhodalysa]ALN97059.1 head-to-tail stopper [Rhodococcus phage TWAMP]ALO80613.1 head-to-tail stopper [Rhodococcus phage Lillie]AOQ27464.1 head-to-tail stopper [Rhodococcus phage Natosaleda]ASR84264.1 head-to-tail stopper [Rhodococcus phage StCroix]ASR84328.1 head-to-tail stopper [Rhodococcus phage Naiad]ASR84462.1 head-to-tail stopper [Rh